MRWTLETAELSRRKILKLLLGTGAGFIFGGVPALAQQSQLKRIIPSSGESISAMGLGTSRTLDVGPSPAERADVTEILRLFVQESGCMVDTSPMYGRAEQVIGDLAKTLKIQDRLFLATKVWSEDAEQGVAQMQNSMRLMNTERIDLMQVHNLINVEAHLKTLKEWKAQDKIRYIGITHYQTEAYGSLENLIKKHRIDFVQFNYSIITRQAERRLLPLCADRGVGVIVNRPFEKGELFKKIKGKKLPSWAGEFDCASWAQFFLKFLLSHPVVTNVIPATSNPVHLIDNMKAGVGLLPDRKTRIKMTRYFSQI